MATAAALTIELLATVDSPAPGTGAVIERVTVTERWTDGTGSGKIGRVYHVTGSLSASGAVTLNLLSAGALKDRFNATVDLDEIKGVVFKCITGSLEFTAAAANGLALFSGASEGLSLTAGQTVAVNLGSVGIVMGSNASLTITEVSTTLGATYEIILVGAE